VAGGVRPDTYTDGAVYTCRINQGRALLFYRSGVKANQCQVCFFLPEIAVRDIADARSTLQERTARLGIYFHFDGRVLQHLIPSVGKRFRMPHKIIQAHAVRGGQHFADISLPSRFHNGGEILSAPVRL